MKKISSKLTRMQKKFFPIMWFGFLGLFVFLVMLSPKTNDKALFPFLIIPTVMAVFGYYMMKKLVFDLVDEVYDCSEYLLIKNNGKEDKIILSNIINVNYSEFTRPPRVSLMLRHESVFGKEIAFYPVTRFKFLEKNPDIVELIHRIDRARLGK